MAHTVDTWSLKNVTSTNPVTLSYTCGAGTTVLIVGILYLGVQTFSNITYNGIALTKAGITRGISPYVDVWYLLNPPTGAAYTISAPNPNTRATAFHVLSAKAAAGKTSELDVVTGTASAGATDPSISQTTTTNGDFVAAFTVSGSATWSPTASTHTQITSLDYGTWGAASQYTTQTTAGSITMGWTFSEAADYGITLVSFKEVTPGEKINNTTYSKWNNVIIAKWNNQ